MPYKSSKQDSSDVLTLEWVLQVKNYKLTLDKHRCMGCQICCLACPKEAVTVERQLKIGEKTLKPKVDINLDKCNFCGICDVTCPFGAIQVTLNGVHNLALIATKSYPKLERTITLDPKECPKTCSNCETACPFQLIKVSKTGFDGKPVEDIHELSLTEKRRIKVSVDIKKEYCPTCKICEINCPPKTLRVTKIFEGKIAIDSSKCSLNCHACVDVCPIPNVLTVDTDGKVVVNEVCCIYCGACKNVCPVEVDALLVKRIKVAHERVHSGAWNKALEKLTSKRDGVKALKAVASIKKRDIVIKRLQDE
ncbi:MAG: 4Fe-4S dicluster domain-containing protein [Candidatus Bathyarchaeota archaeon]|uniref:4Fe-4S dicluster domain-containing protein n=1 Tax=Candidatus Bathycorpusculum sp. TaxID=2994959 RepID=UPI00281DE021|nr:4Fe-4S dicluster domain-containing protein [Candidatus Termiticorpusculum sp.]MCL2257745.1 4Fe-4S dicluster domain-containing protein [Candidatus Termiticorpusculum sp.]MCL2291971.1 4Fe-4S dicluster domain-containing protein [Candidatus Termiticorpusculum sp.]